MFRKTPALFTLFVCVTLIAACGRGDGDTQSQATPTNDAQTPEWLLTSAPTGAVSVTEAKASADEGDRVVLRARIGGRKQPIAADSPAFTVMDLAIPHCGQLHGDRCATPWDYCCETPENITQNAATVQLVDTDGNPLNVDPTVELTELDEILIVGTVRPRPSPSVLTVAATGVYRVEP
jgi:hypothetical protein